jgi:predicted metal-dependent peptidase
MSTITLQRAAKVSPLQKAIAQMRRDPHTIGYAALLSTMRVYEADVETACTDTVSYIKVGAKFFEQLTPSMRQFALIHEVFHKWQGFFARFEAWSKKYPGVPRNKLFSVMNMAGDHLINWHLKHNLGLELPVWLDEDGNKASVLYDVSCNNNTMTMEQLADKIMKGEGPPPPKGAGGAPQSGKGKPQPGQGEGEPTPGDSGLEGGGDVALPDMYNGDIGTKPSNADIKNLEATVRRDMANAARAAKAAGDRSGFGEMMADESKKDKHNWMQALYRYAATMRNHGALSYARPNRRYKVPGGRIQLPSRRSKVMGSVAIFMDTSGSTMGELISQVMAEVKSVLRNVDFDTLYVLHVDAAVRHVDAFKKGDLHKWEPKLYGGGGTRFAPAFRYAYRELPKLDAIVYHTDGYSGRNDLIECEDLWKKMGQPPVLWALNDMPIEKFKRIAEFGTMMDCR